MLTDERIERYSRQIVLPEVGGKGQERLLSCRVLVVGVGGLGSPCAFYLAAAGVGTLGLMDGDVVELSNLQRQILHSTRDLTRPKVESAAVKLQALNPDVTVEALGTRLTPTNAVATVERFDVVVDGTDGFASKYLVADACHFARRPYVHAGILQFAGQAMTVRPGSSACLRCVFPAPPPADAVPTCALQQLFHDAHSKAYGHAMPRKEVEAVHLRLQAIGLVDKPALERETCIESDGSNASLEPIRVLCPDGPRQFQRYHRELLQPGAAFAGPSLVLQMDSTVLITPGWSARVDGYRNLILERAT